MNIIKPSFQILTRVNTQKVMQDLEVAGRTCYKSQDLITEDSAANFVDKIIKNGHHSVLEHFSISVLIICDRGISHELVRHRLASYSQESTRFVRYASDEITFIQPCFWDTLSMERLEWKIAMRYAEAQYEKLMKLGVRPEQARSVLPNSLKTEVVMTCNLREWRHIFKLRCAKQAHPQMREIMIPMLKEFSRKLPIVFRDIKGQFLT